MFSWIAGWSCLKNLDYITINFHGKIVKSAKLEKKYMEMRTFNHMVWPPFLIYNWRFLQSNQDCSVLRLDIAMKRYKAFPCTYTIPGFLKIQLKIWKTGRVRKANVDRLVFNHLLCINLLNKVNQDFWISKRMQNSDFGGFLLS